MAAFVIYCEPCSKTMGITFLKSLSRRDHLLYSEVSTRDFAFGLSVLLSDAKTSVFIYTLAFSRVPNNRRFPKRASCSVYTQSRTTGLFTELPPDTTSSKVNEGKAVRNGESSLFNHSTMSQRLFWVNRILYESFIEDILHIPGC